MKTEEKEKKIEDSRFGPAGYCLVVFLFFLFFNVTGLYGLKFAACFSVSWLTGFVIWFIRVLFQDANDTDGIDKPFNWFLFLMFPLFIPLSLPLWAIPFILIISYLISIVAFGGHGKHIFNPIIIATVILLYGYNDYGLIAPSCSLPDPYSGYKIWSSGVPPRIDIREILSTLPFKSIYTLAMTGNIPNMPGSCYSPIILLVAILFGVVFKRRLIWLFLSIFTIIIVAFIFSILKGGNIAAINVLSLGIVPSLLLCGIADFTTIPESKLGQSISAIIFSILVVIFFYNSSNILAPVYAFLIFQVVSPLIIDIVELKK